MKAVKQQRSRPRRRRGSLRPWLLLFRFVVIAFVAGVIWCGYAAWYINNHETTVEDGLHADAGIVLGAALWNDRPSPALKERLDYALSLYEDGIVDRLILSGGHGGLSSTISEAEGMRDYLTAKGMPEDKLLLETDSTSTYQNLVFSKRLGESEGATDFLVITHDYHAPRAAEIAAFAGFEPANVAGVKSRVLNEFYNDSREVLAYTKWKLDYALIRIGIRSPESML
ncbi:YdcF family protein [Paenibacillus sp. LHD-117]|uniref:YdcF family protein n=1 Tax=Paenibacillus sp. LHD-117 TaxID=3071412 RepID=UPI0027E1FF6A|nr:YdcF family protein [Paenibacillus sp. LHD-117]MDQ6418107.1 YdcF family protein [Paenibacillus sp. LHD-117]